MLRNCLQPELQGHMLMQNYFWIMGILILWTTSEHNNLLINPSQRSG